MKGIKYRQTFNRMFVNGQTKLTKGSIGGKFGIAKVDGQKTYSVIHLPTAYRVAKGFLYARNAQQAALMLTERGGWDFQNGNWPKLDPLAKQIEEVCAELQDGTLAR